ncbi:two-partner secretion domain-containing protein [Schwartzia succinivorans]|jgi:filamentous hemagglutinin family protein|uniref:Filamentous hemagglutinin family N-terminal domain-containing protein n=1 Tax=Schwartzia succinivorans DSM 10502 TaxID=1123243 RepID=A0A1M4XB46_9FIRM|nr:filamentous hemagglutinin N-terminal domain-containing protein [Schwartzia succinivorans]SHE90653.1 filamentous hemagglutinin family N-terminal domain-containing protein [Schwartzia succinivorans DSM 10502]
MRLQRIGKNARLAAAIAMTLFSASVSAVYAMPTDGVVKSGQATISSVVDNTMNINQTTDRVAIDWTSFDIAANETVNFVQPNANSIALNRVTGNDVSEIYGALNANGKVFLLNTSGILFAEGASINVNGLVASTGELKDINNTNNLFDVTKFADGKDFVLEVQNDHGKPENPAVINRADINARINEEGGLVVLHAINVENHGTIKTGNGGIVQLAAGKKLKVNYDSDKVNFAVTVDDKSGLKAADVLNAGTISAQNGIIAMTARGADKVISSVVNTDGARLEANGLAVNEKGEIILEAGTVGKTPDKSWGVVDMGGTIDVSGVNGADGGTITAKARSISIDGTLDASGANSGTIAPEYSGLLVTDNAKINIAAANGTNGKFTVNTEDTVDIKSAATGLNRTDAEYTKNLYAAVGRDNVVISNVALSNMLTGTDVDITAHNVKHLVSDIVISGDVTKTGDRETTLKLTADRNVVFGGAVTSDKKLNITTKAGSPIMLEQGNRDGELFGANILWKNVNTKGDINLGGNTFVGILDGTSESGREIAGNNVTLGGDVVVAVADTLEINAEKDAKIEGSVNSGNAYKGGTIEGMTYEKVNGKVNYWATARKAARNGTEGGSAVGDSYLVTITDGLEDSAVAAVLPSREKKAYTGGKASSKLVYDEVNGTTTREWRWADGPEAGQVYFVQTSEMNRGTGYSTKAVSGYATTDGTTDTKGYTNFSSGDPNNDGANGQTVMSVGFNNSNPGWSGYGEDYTMSRWDDAYEDMGSSYLLYIRETNLEESSLRVNAGGDIEVKGPIGDKKNLAEVTLNAGGGYRYNPDDAAVIRLDEIQTKDLMAAASTLQGSAGVRFVDSARAGDVEKVAGLMDGQMPLYKVTGNRMIPEGLLEISATPDAVNVKVNPAADGVPAVPRTRDANQYREYQKMLDTVDGAADFKLTYDGASFEIYPVDGNGQAVLQKGDSAGNVDVTAAALHAAFSEMGLSLEDMEAVLVHMNA